MKLKNLFIDLDKNSLQKLCDHYFPVSSYLLRYFQTLPLLPKETRIWLWVWVGCNLFALLNVLWGALYTKVINRFLFNWGEAWSGQFVRWNLMALIIPPIIRFANRHPYNKERPWSSLLRYFGGGALFALIHNICHSILFASVHINKSGMPFTIGTLLYIIMDNYWQSFVAYIAVLAFAQAFDYYASYQQSQLNYQESLLRESRLETQLAQAQLDALKAQLQPHFIFNALNSISALQLRDLRAAQKMIANLGQFLRMTLKKTKTQEVILDHEIEFLRLYLDIEQVRFQDRLTINFKIDPETLYACVPNLILQPIVENAIKHAVAQLTTVAYINIIVDRVDEQLILQVIDNGPGIVDIEKFWIEQKIGIGLANTRARLAYLYGSNQKLELQNSPEGGLIVRIAIPFQIHTDATMEVYLID